VARQRGLVLVYVNPVLARYSRHLCVISYIRRIFSHSAQESSGGGSYGEWSNRVPVTIWSGGVCAVGMVDILHNEKPLLPKKPQQDQSPVNVVAGIGAGWVACFQGNLPKTRRKNVVHCRRQRRGG